MAVTPKDSSDTQPDDAEDVSNDDDQIIAEAKAFMALVSEAESDNRLAALDDLRFRAGDQWPQEIKSQRAQDKRPCLVVNRMPQNVQQVTNDQRQNRPSIKIHPVDSGADIETAKIRQGIIRHIEYDSNAEVAYDTAFESAVGGGWGFFRITTEYSDPLSFDQDIKIKRIRNPFSVYFDPHAQEPDGSDAKRALITEDLSPDDYKARYKNSKLASLDDWTSIGNDAPTWFKDGHCRVAEFFYTEYTEVEIVQLSNGDVVEKAKLQDHLTELSAKLAASSPGAPLNIQAVKERTALKPSIKWCKLNAVEILEKTDWLGKWIPIIPVYGTELYIDGERILEGVIRHAKDPQRMLNFWKSAETEAIALAPRAPWTVAVGQIEGFEQIWATANSRNHSYLPYNPKSIDGTPVPPPQRNAVEPAVGAITQASMGAAEDIKATTGIYDASLGNRSNETSGVAIQRRNIQAQTSNFHFTDNLTRAIKHTGRVIDDLLPHIYDTARAQRIIGDDGEQRVVRVNDPSFQENGKQAYYDLSTGKYDVTVDVGPSFASKRQEAAAAMLELAKSIPAIATAAPDLIVRSMDGPGSPELADRLKKTLPPGLADDNKGQAPLPPEVQGKMQQMGHMIEQLTQQLHVAHDERDQKTLELESKERIEFKKLEVQLEIERAKIDAKDSLAIFDAEIAQINQRLSMIGINQPIDETEQNFAPQSGDGGMSASPGPEAQPQPTGGLPPGSPMEEGNFQ